MSDPKAIEEACRREVDAFREAAVRAITRATYEYCSCGGSGPNDPEACKACLVYHASIRALPAPP